MTTEAARIYEQALNLPVLDRQELANLLMNSVLPVDPEVDAIWMKEVEARSDAFDSGRVSATDADEAFRELDRE